MPKYEILVEYKPPLDVEFKRAVRDIPEQFVSAKVLMARIGDEISWRLLPPDAPPADWGLSGKQPTGFTIEFLTTGSPFDSRERIYSFRRLATTPMVVTPWAAGRFFPYEISLDGLGVKFDPGVGVEPPGDYLYLTIEACRNSAGGIELEPHTLAHPQDMLRFCCRDVDGGPIDFQVTFGGMSIEDWPVDPQGHPEKPFASIAGTGVTEYRQVVATPEDYPFTLTTVTGASASAIIGVRPRTVA